MRISHTGDVRDTCEKCKIKCSNDRYADNRLQFVTIIHNGIAWVTFICGNCYSDFLFETNQKSDAKTKNPFE